MGQDITKRAAGHKSPGARSAFKGVARNALEKFQLGALLHPDHVANMGAAVWVFLWLWSNAKVDQAPLAGEVFEGRAFSLELMAHELGMNTRTIQRHLATLRRHDYLETQFDGPNGMIAVIMLWRSENEKSHDRIVVGSTENTHDNSVVDTHGENTHDKSVVGSSCENDNSHDRSGVGSAKNAETGVPPLNNPPYNEFVKRVYKEPTTTNVVMLHRGKDQPVDAVVEVNQGREGRRVSPASKALDKELSLIPGHERPIRTKTLERVFLDLSPHDIGLVFDAVRRERTTSTWLDNPPGWWASLLYEHALLLRKQRYKERKEEGDL